MEKISIGIGQRNYGYKRLVYGLPVEGVRYAKGIYVPWNRLGSGSRLYNTYYFLPYPKFDLLHLWNGVLLNRRPFVTTFESWLPRVFDGRRGWYYRLCLERLMSDDCRKFFAMSDFARQFFLWQNRDLMDPSELLNKVEVMYGGVPVHAHALEHRLERLQNQPEGVLRACFIGHEFFRKGGLPIIRAFDRLARELPNVKLIAVSRLGGDYASHETRTGEARATLQQASWAEWHEALPHHEVMRLIEQSGRRASAFAGRHVRLVGARSNEPGFASCGH